MESEGWLDFNFIYMFLENVQIKSSYGKTKAQLQIKQSYQQHVFNDAVCLKLNSQQESL